MIIFINKVVVEMKVCVVDLVGNCVKLMWVLIFYFVVVRILCIDIDCLGIFCNFLIYDDMDVKRFIIFVICD